MTRSIAHCCLALVFATGGATAGLCVNPIAAPSATPKSPALADAVSRARAFVQREIAPATPGFSIAVSVEGKVIWSEGFGLASLEKKTPVTAATRFRIGSVSKPLTAAGLALLVERGKLELDAPLQKYVPDFPDKGAAITTRLLAGHLSGIRNYRGREIFLNQPFPSLRAGLKIFEDDPLESPPGTKFSYSSYNWNAIGVAMEHAAQQDFLRYMDENVFRPLGLADTGPDRAGGVDEHRAQFYENDTVEKFTSAPAVDSSYKWPSGGFLSTTEDLVRFGCALLQPGFLKKESLQLLFTSQKTSAGKPTHYGVGWFVVRDMQGHDVFFHEGNSVGGAAVLLLRPASRTVVAIACNVGELTYTHDNGRKSLTKAAARPPATEKNAMAIADFFAPSQTETPVKK